MQIVHACSILGSRWRWHAKHESKRVPKLSPLPQPSVFFSNFESSFGGSGAGAGSGGRSEDPGALSLSLLALIQHVEVSDIRFQGV